MQSSRRSSVIIKPDEHACGFRFDPWPCSGLRIWRCRELWSDSPPRLGTSICHRRSPNRQKTKKQNKTKKKVTNEALNNNWSFLITCG